jgi:hypothetical protein
VALSVSDGASGKAGENRGWAPRITVEADTDTEEETVEGHVPTVIDTAQDRKTGKKGRR